MKRADAMIKAGEMLENGEVRNKFDKQEHRTREDPGEDGIHL